MIEGRLAEIMGDFNDYFSTAGYRNRILLSWLLLTSVLFYQTDNISNAAGHTPPPLLSSSPSHN